MPLGQQAVAQGAVLFALGLDVALVVIPQDHGDRACTFLADLLDADRQFRVVDVVVAEIERQGDQGACCGVDVVDVLGRDLHLQGSVVHRRVAEFDHLDRCHVLTAQIKAAGRSEALVVVLLERDLVAGDGRLQQRVRHDARQRLAAVGVFRQDLQVAIGGLVGDVRRNSPDHLLRHQFAGLYTINDLGRAVVMDADLVQIDLFAGEGVGTQPLEDLNRNRIRCTAKLLGDCQVEGQPSCRVIQDRQILGRDIARIAGRALTEDIRLAGVQRLLEECGRIEVQPQRTFVLVRDGCKRGLGIVADDVLTDAIDDVLPGAVREQHDALRHFLDLPPRAHIQGRQNLLHDSALLLLALLLVQIRHRQTELHHHEFTEHRWRQVAKQLGQVLGIVH